MCKFYQKKQMMLSRNMGNSVTVTSFKTNLKFRCCQEIKSPHFLTTFKTNLKFCFFRCFFLLWRSPMAAWEVKIYQDCGRMMWAIYDIWSERWSSRKKIKINLINIRWLAGITTLPDCTLSEWWKAFYWKKGEHNKKIICC